MICLDLTRCYRRLRAPARVVERRRPGDNVAVAGYWAVGLRLGRRNTQVATVGNVAGNTTQTVGSTVGTTTGVVSNTTGAVQGTTGNTVGALRGLQVTQSGGASAQGGSTLGLSGGNLRLDSGTTFNLLLNGSANAGNNQ